jgi:hypothetical protein
LVGLFNCKENPVQLAGVVPGGYPAPHNLAPFRLEGAGRLIFDIKKKKEKNKKKEIQLIVES